MESTTPILSATFSSPSKIILSGEHAVVYGHPAIAFAVGPPAGYDQECGEESEGICNRTCCTVTVYGNKDGSRPFLKWKSKIFDQTFQTIDDLLDFENKTEYEIIGAKVFMNAANRAFSNCQDAQMKQVSQLYAFDINFGFGVPVGAGLGSSASFNSVASGAVYLTFKHLASGVLSNDVNFSEQDLYDIKDLTDMGEGIVHGNPSGIDSYIINYGGAVKFTKKEDGIECDRDIKIHEDFDFDIVFTGVSRQTKTSLTNMINLKNTFPDVFNSVLSSIASVTNEFEKLMASSTLDLQNVVYMTNVNNKLLQSLQLSVPIIDELCMVADECQVGLKITGAGCGGCLLATYSEKSEKQAFFDKIQAMADRGVRLIKAGKSLDGFKVDKWEIKE